MVTDLKFRKITGHNFEYICITGVLLYDKIGNIEILSKVSKIQRRRVGLLEKCLDGLDVKKHR